MEREELRQRNSVITTALPAVADASWRGVGQESPIGDQQEVLLLQVCLELVVALDFLAGPVGQSATAAVVGA